MPCYEAFLRRDGVGRHAELIESRMEDLEDMGTGVGGKEAKEKAEVKR